MRLKHSSACASRVGLGLIVERVCGNNKRLHFSFLNMTGLALFLILLSAILHAFKSLFIKTSGNKYVFTLLYWVGGDILIFPPVIAYLLLNDVNELQLIAETSPYIWGMLGLGIAAHAIYFFSQAKIYMKGDLSLVYPLSRLAPLFVLLWGLFVLNEDVSGLGIAGIIVTIFGTWVIMLEKFSLRHIFGTVKKVREFTIFMALFTSIISAVFFIADQVAVLHFHPALFVVFLSVDMLICAPIVIWKCWGEFGKEWRNNKRNIILTSFFDYPGYYLVLIAFALAPLSYIVALRQLSVVIGVVFGYLLLKEPYGKFRILGSVIIFAGSFLIGAFG
jgi:drug/metabolite transporter (DMT)-like permease